jgi:uncharacterized SAM-dependent methyltransferase
VLVYAFGATFGEGDRLSHAFEKIKSSNAEQLRDVVTVRLEKEPATLSEEREAEHAFDLSGATDYDAELDRIFRYLGAVAERKRDSDALARSRVSHVSGVIEATVAETTLFSQLQEQLVTGKIDQKFLYWDVRAAMRWQKLAEASTYMTAQTSMNILAARGREIIFEFKRRTTRSNFTFINFGVGTGTKDYLILDQLLSHDQSARVLYVPIDESLPMIHLTILQLQELMGRYSDRLKVCFVLDDFANADRFNTRVSDQEVSWFGHSDYTRLVAFLGGSLGNFPERLVLDQIRTLMRPKIDMLLLGIEYIGNRDERELALNYDNEGNREFVYGPIRDIDTSDPDWREHIDIGVRSNQSDVRASKTIIGIANHHGSRIQLFSSTKYRREEFEEFLAQEGFDILGTFTTDEVTPTFGKYLLRQQRRAG